MTELQQMANDLANQLNQERKVRQELEAKVENQEKALDNIRIALEKYTRENKALKELVGLWATN